MKLILDTHVVLWMVGRRSELSADLQTILDDPDNTLLASSAAVVEVSIKTAKGQLRVPEDWPERVEAAGCAFLPITARHARRLRTLPLMHEDPFDRLLVAQALEENAVLVTRDADLRLYGVPTLRA